MICYAAFSQILHAHISPADLRSRKLLSPLCGTQIRARIPWGIPQPVLVNLRTGLYPARPDQTLDEDHCPTKADHGFRSRAANAIMGNVIPSSNYSHFGSHSAWESKVGFSKPAYVLLSPAGCLTLIIRFRFRIS